MVPRPAACLLHSSPTSLETASVNHKPILAAEQGSNLFLCAIQQHPLIKRNQAAKAHSNFDTNWATGMVVGDERVELPTSSV